MALKDGADLVTDYLVVGAGTSGLGFVDELLTRTKANVIIVDKRDLPGGHWVDSYPFVKLHQPSVQYGVNSVELSNGRINDRGLNRGLLDLASGSELKAYYHVLMRDRFLPSGRVTFLPMTEYLPDGKLRDLITGKTLTVHVNKRLVDAAWYTNRIPLTHTRSFSVDTAATCIPPNDLPRLAGKFEHFAVLGAGKTAMDSCIWLLEHDIDPSRIRWVIPNDYWFFNRAKFQTRQDFFLESFDGLAAMFENIGTARDPTSLALGNEKCGVWLRLDPNLEPKQFHAATMTTSEIEALQRIPDVVRKGYVRSIGADHLQLTDGRVEAKPNTLYIDCTASCLPDRPLVPVFQPGKIVLQMIQYPLLAFSAAKIAFLESLDVDDSERNNFSEPLLYPKSVIDYIVYSMATDMSTRAKEMQDPRLQAWLAQARVDGWTGMAAAVKPEETEKVALLKRMEGAFVAALQNVPQLVASARGVAVA